MTKGRHPLTEGQHGAISNRLVAAGMQPLQEHECGTAYLAYHSTRISSLFAVVAIAVSVIGVLTALYASALHDGRVFLFVYFLVLLMIYLGAVALLVPRLSANRAAEAVLARRDAGVTRTLHVGPFKLRIQ